MAKAEIIAVAVMAGKAFAVAFYMELERRLGNSKYGSVLGLVFGWISGMFRKSKETK